MRFKERPEKTSLSDKYKAHELCCRPSLDGRQRQRLMSFAENDQAHKGF